MSVCRTRRIVPPRSIARMRSITSSTSSPDCRAISPNGSRTKPWMRSSETARICALIGIGVGDGSFGLGGHGADGHVHAIIAFGETYIESHGDRLFAILRTAFFATLFVSLWVWFIPRWLARGRPRIRDWSVVPIVLMVIGGAIMLRCVWDFAWTGRGTPAPFDPPRRLVVAGLYRYVRNPMYLGMAIFLVGEALLLPEITREMLIVLVAAWVAVTAFILLLRRADAAPALRRGLREYCRNVRRWIPRLTPFDKHAAAGVTSPRPGLICGAACNQDKKS